MIPNWKPQKRGKDTRHAYGIACLWHDTIWKTGRTKPMLTKAGHTVSLPCCPGCGSMLMEVPTEESWWEQVRQHEAHGHPGYEKLTRWGQGRCFRTMAALVSAYNEAHPSDLYIFVPEEKTDAPAV